jgi:hypothetical protein
VDSVAIEFRIADRMHGIEFMGFEPTGLVSFASGNYALD